MVESHPLERVEPVLLIAIGGFAGANARFGIDTIIAGDLLATFLANVLGSFALGVLVYDSLSRGVVGSNARLVFGTGFLSSFTTYSTFVLGTVTHPEMALVYVVGSYGCGFGAVFVARGTVSWIDQRASKEHIGGS